MNKYGLENIQNIELKFQANTNRKINLNFFYKINYPHFTLNFY